MSNKSHRHMTRLIAGMAAFLLLCQPLQARQSGTSGQNAAELYRNAVAELETSLSAEERTALPSLVQSSNALTEAQLAAVEKAQPALAIMHEAAQLDHVDWGVDLSSGPEAEMPWLTEVRALMYVAAADARVKAAAGDGSGAVQRLLDLRAMSRHAAQDLVLVNYLLYVGGDLLASQSAAVVLPQLPQEQVQALTDGFAALPSAPQLADAIRVEGEMWTRWLSAEEDAPWKLVAQLQEVDVADIRVKAQHRQDWAQNREKLIEGVKDTFDAAEAIAKLPQRERAAHFERWAAALEQMNWLVPIVVPSFDRAAEADYRHAVQAALLEAAVAVVLEGEGALEGHPDPATGEPFKYEEQGEGFVLTSEKEMDGQPIRFEMRSKQ